jgi:hypothetical protein
MWTASLSRSQDLQLVDVFAAVKACKEAIKLVTLGMKVGVFSVAALPRLLARVLLS